MEDREALMMTAAINIVAAVKGDDIDVAHAVKGDTAGRAFLAGKHGPEALNVFETLKKEFNWED